MDYSFSRDSPHNNDSVVYNIELFLNRFIGKKMKLRKKSLIAKMFVVDHRKLLNRPKKKSKINDRTISLFHMRIYFRERKCMLDIFEKFSNNAAPNG